MGPLFLASVLQTPLLYSNIVAITSDSRSGSQRASRASHILVDKHSCRTRNDLVYEPVVLRSNESDGLDGVCSFFLRLVDSITTDLGLIRRRQSTLRLLYLT